MSVHSLSIFKFKPYEPVRYETRWQQYDRHVMLYSQVAARHHPGEGSKKLSNRALLTRGSAFPFSKYCPHAESTLENCGSPTLRFGKALDFCLSF
jgi:hypothetical protein